MMSRNYGEFNLHGCTFEVYYDYYHGAPATQTNPPEPASIEILSVNIKGQPEGDAESLLTAIRTGLTVDFNDIIRFDDGFDLLSQLILEEH